MDVRVMVFAAVMMLSGSLLLVQSGCGSADEPKQIEGSLFEKREFPEIPDRPEEK